MSANNKATQMENGYPRIHDVLFHHDEKSAERIDAWIKSLPEPKHPDLIWSPAPDEEDSVISSMSDEKEEQEVREEPEEVPEAEDNRV